MLKCKSELQVVNFSGRGEHSVPISETENFK